MKSVIAKKIKIKKLSMYDPETKELLDEFVGEAAALEASNMYGVSERLLRERCAKNKEYTVGSFMFKCDVSYSKVFRKNISSVKKTALIDCKKKKVMNVYESQTLAAKQNKLSLKCVGDHCAGHTARCHENKTFRNISCDGKIIYTPKDKRDKIKFSYD